MSPLLKQYVGTIAGVLFVLVGIVGLVLPFLQGVLFIAVGSVLLSMFCPPVGRKVAKIKARHPFAALYLDRAENLVERFFRLTTHTQKRYRVVTRNGGKIIVLVDHPKTPSKGIALVMHGLGGYKEQPVIRALANTYADMGFTTVRFDATDSVGESSGKYSFGTTTGMLADLIDVIEWGAKMPFWDEKPLLLSGHSLGGLCVCEYAQQHPSRVAGLVLAAPVISGARSQRAIETYHPDVFEAWERVGYRLDSVASRAPYNQLPLSHLTDRMSYDITRNVQKLTMPVLILSGTDDTNTPIDDLRALYIPLTGEKQLQTIDGADHYFKTHNDVARIREAVHHWVTTHTNAL